jgi:hypothetical protein
VRDSNAIDIALLAHLRDDATLTALLPDGVYMDVGPPGAMRFVLVSVIIAEDTGTFDGRAIEDVLYLVKAVVLGSANGDIAASAARIDALLEDGVFPIDGYGLLSSVREERVRFTEPDSADPGIRWYHRGGRYRVQATPLPSTTTRAAIQGAES